MSLLSDIESQIK